MDDCSRLVKQFHYSHRSLPQSSCISVTTIHSASKGLVTKSPGRCLAGIWFSHPPARWKEPVVELLRLCRRDDFIWPLTKLISIGIKNLPQEVDLIVSFADPQFNHHGGIYQAASFNYHGVRASRIDGFVFGKKFIPARTVFHRYGTNSLSKLRERFGPTITIEPHYDIGKHLYWKARTKKGRDKAKRLGLKISSYPKPRETQ